MVTMHEYSLSPANGCVPDLTGPLVKDWPAKSGETKRDDTFKISAKSATDCPRLAELVLYEHIDFGGASAQTSLNWYYVGSFWNDRMSSVVILGGKWRFYEHWHYQGQYWDLGPGQYRWVNDAGIPNDTISSFQLISFC